MIQRGHESKFPLFVNLHEICIQISTLKWDIFSNPCSIYHFSTIECYAYTLHPCFCSAAFTPRLNRFPGHSSCHLPANCASPSARPPSSPIPLHATRKYSRLGQRGSTCTPLSPRAQPLRFKRTSLGNLCCACARIAAPASSNGLRERSKSRSSHDPSTASRPALSPCASILVFCSARVCSPPHGCQFKRGQGSESALSANLAKLTTTVKDSPQQHRYSTGERFPAKQPPPAVHC